jgi:hypothetical protein
MTGKARGPLFVQSNQLEELRKVGWCHHLVLVRLGLEPVQDPKLRPLHQQCRHNVTMLLDLGMGPSQLRLALHELVIERGERLYKAVLITEQGAEKD